MAKKIFFKLFLAVLPVLLIGVFYLWADPFMIVRHYDDLYNTEKPHLELNEDYATTETFLNLNPKEKFDSYIFGSSRSRYYTPAEFEKRVYGAKAYQFGVARETLFGIAGKVKMLHRQGVKIKHVLVVADAELLSKATNTAGHLFRKHPLVSGEGDADFQFTCLMDFFSWEAISGYIKLPSKAAGKKKDPQMEAEELIQKDKDSYYKPRMHLFYERKKTLQTSKPVLEAAQIKLLREMQAIFAKDGTDFRMVISPTYDQEKFNEADKKIINSIFGQNCLYDFSGINDITADMYNYYESIHYRPFIAYRIMDSVYKTAVLSERASEVE
jgi:hypothetical protein